MKNIKTEAKTELVKRICDYCHEIYHETYINKGDYNIDGNFCSSRCEFLYKREFD